MVGTGVAGLLLLLCERDAQSACCATTMKCKQSWLLQADMDQPEVSASEDKKIWRTTATLAHVRPRFMAMLSSSSACVISLHVMARREQTWSQVAMPREEHPRCTRHNIRLHDLRGLLAIDDTVRCHVHSGDG